MEGEDWVSMRTLHRASHEPQEKLLHTQPHMGICLPIEKAESRKMTKTSQSKRRKESKTTRACQARRQYTGPGGSE